MNTITLWTVQEPKFALDGTMNAPMQFRSVEAFETGTFGNLGVTLPNGYIMTLYPMDNTRKVYVPFPDNLRRPKVFYCPTQRGALREYYNRLWERVAEQQRASEKLQHLVEYLETLRIEFEEKEEQARDARLNRSFLP